MKKLKKFLTSLIGITAATAVAIPTITSCSNQDKKELINEEQNGQPATVQYTTVTFCNPDAEKITIKGAAVVKAKVGRQFATVKQPVASKENAKFAFWTLDEPGTETPTAIPMDTPITVGLKVYPVFEDQILLANCIGISAIETTTITLHNQNGNAPDIHYTQNYGKDGWPEFKTTEPITLQPGQNIFFKGLNDGSDSHQLGFSQSDTMYSWIGFTGATDPAPAINISGNIMGLINDGTGNNSDTIPNNYCFYHLLNNNPAIKYVSDTFLPATNLTEHCYDGLFSGCTSIITAPYLPADSLNVPTAISSSNATYQSYCYNELFDGCSSLNMVRLAYKGNFNNCFTNWLNGVAETGEIVYDGGSYEPSESTIPAGWSAKQTTTDIKIECTDIMYKKAVAGGKEYDFTVNHPYQLEATGDHRDPETSNEVSEHITWYSSDTRVATVNPDSGVVTGLRSGSVDIYAQATDGTGTKASFSMNFKNLSISNTAYFEVQSDTKVSWDYVGAGSLPTFSYSIDNGASWHRMQAALGVNVAAGEKIYIKGDNINGITPKNSPSASYAHFSFDDQATQETPVKAKIGGNVMGLLDDCRGELTSLTDLTELSSTCNYKWCFNHLFSDELITEVASDFLKTPTDLSEGCFSSMFNGCTALTKAPDLTNKALKAYCYSNMFRDCESLVNPPVFPTSGTVTLGDYCCMSMFYDCHSLQTAPELLATGAAVGCYSFMFQYCWNMKTVKRVHLTDLKDSCCFQMYALSDSQRGKSAKIEFDYRSSWYDYVVWSVPNPETVPEDALVRVFDGLTPTKGQTWGYYSVS